MKIKSKNFIFVDPDNLDELEAKLSQILHQQSIKESTKLHELHELHDLHKDSPKFNEVKVLRKAGRPRKTRFETKAITTQSDDELST